MRPYLACKFDYIWNQTKPKLLDTLVRNFLNWIIWSGTIHPESGPYILVASHIKGHERRKLLFLACLSILSLASSSIQSPWDSFTGVRTDFFKSLTQADKGQSQGPSGTPVQDWDCWDFQPCRLGNYGILGPSVMRWPLLYYLEHSL